MSEIPCIVSYVPNTTMKIFVNSLGKQTQYRFYPNDGYVIHVKRADAPIFDETNENVMGYIEMYGSAMKSVSIGYDFSVVTPDTYTFTDESGNTNSIPIERIGAEELYTLPKDVVLKTNLY